MKNVRLLISSVLISFGFILNAHAQTPIIRTIAGSTAGFGGDGSAATAAAVKLNTNYMITLDASGNLLIADNLNARIREISKSTGIISTVAGSATTGMGGDGTAATIAQLGAGGGVNAGVVGVTIDGAGNFYIGDATNNKVRRVDGTTGIITTVAGTGTVGSTGDGSAATAALLSGPRGVAVNTAGTLLYIADAGNNKIRLVNLTTGIISTFAGVGGAGAFSGDGAAATAAQFNAPRGLWLDATGNLYITDMTNQRVRKVDIGTLFISTVAGSNIIAGFAGDGAPATAARLSGPTDMKMDALGNMYIADVGNNRIRYVDASTGNISSIVNMAGGVGTTGDWGPATAAKLDGAASVAILAPNWYYISDRTNNRVRLVRPNSIPYFNNGSSIPFVVCENTIGDSLNTLLQVTDSDLVQTETWSVVTPPAHGILGGSATRTANGSTLTPVGLYYTPTTGYSGTDAFTIQVSDGYNTATTVVNVTVNPLPVVAAITGASSTVCVGATITLADVTGGGVWSTTIGNASVTAGTVSGVAAGTDVVEYTVTNACGPTTVNYPVTVNPLPNAGSISGPSPLQVCVSSFITLSDPAIGGSWSATNGNASVAGGFVTGVSVGTDDISYSVTNSCGTANAIVTVTVITLPAVAPISAPSTSVCVGSIITMTDGTPGGSWSTAIGNATVVGGVVTGASAGTDNVIYNVTNACGSTNVTQAVTVNPLPAAGSISGAANVCIAGTTPLSDPAPGGAWSAVNGNATVSVGGLVTGVSVGSDVINYTVINGCGTAVASFTINVVSVPSAGTISGPANVCVGASIPLTDPVPGGTWSASNPDATVVSGSVTGVTAGVDVITYTVIVSCGTAFTTYPVTVNPLADAGTITGAANVCVGLTTLLTDASPAGTWSTTSPTASVSGTGVVTGISVGPALISYTVSNGCGSVSATSAMTVNSIITPSVTFSASPGFTTCPGTLVTYTAIPVNGGALPVYEWRVNGTVIGAGSSIIHTPVNHDVFTCEMTSSAACAIPTIVFDTVTVVVLPNLLPSVNISTGAYGDTVCIGNLTTYYATPGNGGATPSYQWYVNSVPSGAGNPYSYVPNNGDIVNCVLSSSYQCPSPPTVMSNSITMTVNTSEVPAVTITVGPGNPVCNGTPVTFTAHTLYGGVPPFLRWTENGINVATGPTYTYLPTNGDNVFCLMASSSTCRTIDSVLSNNIHMTTLTPEAIGVNIHAAATNISAGANDTLTAVVAGASLSATYQWYVNGTIVPGATNSIYVVNASAAGSELVNCAVTSGDVCNTSAVSNVLSLTFDNVGVQQISPAGNELRLLPNPNKGTFTMALQADNNEQMHVVITNVLGEKVKEFTSTTNKEETVQLDRSAGIYLLSATTEHGRYVAKVIIE